MRRGETGEYKVISDTGEYVRAFVPHPLPPSPALVLDGSILQKLEEAALALGSLSHILGSLPTRDMLLYSYIRKEAVLSSQIEGTQSSLSDLLAFELDEASGAPLDDVKETSLYTKAMEYGLRLLKEGLPLSNRLLCEVHGQLLSQGRGGHTNPSEFRPSQNWIGGSRANDADFVPPPSADVPDCMAELEKFMHAENDGLPTLVRVGLAHAQFETIHPFLDGNGRVGRQLITLLLCHAGMLREPLLYISLYFKRHRSTYYELLNQVRRTGDWEKWLIFFLDGVLQTANSAVSTAQTLVKMFSRDREQIKNTGRRAGSALRVHEVFQERPILSRAEACRMTQLSFPAVSSAMALLIEKGVVSEIGSPGKRKKLFAYDECLSILLSEELEAS